jgi:hypothetical protein
MLGTLQSIMDGQRSKSASRTSAGTAAASSARERDSTKAGDGSALDDTLQEHFDSIQELSDKQALEELLPRLRCVLFEVGQVAVWSWWAAAMCSG